MIHEPAGTTPADRRRERRRRDILDAALAIVHEGGLGALTVHGLARSLDYTPGALYRYFDGLEELLLALQVEVAEEWGRALAQVRRRCVGRVADPATAALLPILATAALYRGLAVAEPARFALVSEVLGASRHVLSLEPARRLVPPLMAVLGQVAADFEAAQRVALSPGDAARRALVLMGAAQGLLQLRKLERLAPVPLAADPLVPELAHALLVGWGAEPRALARAADALDAIVAESPLVAFGATP